MTLRIGWFSTARGPGSSALLTAAYDGIRSGDIKAEIEFVFCSRGPGESDQTDLFLRTVSADYRLPLVTLSCRKFKKQRAAPAPASSNSLPTWRLDYDRAIMAKLSPYRPDLCVLAGYMLIVGPEMCRRYDMINLHPAAPGGPTGTWQEVIWQLIASGARETGVMMHLVTPELDKGPPVTYCTFPIRGEPFDSLWRDIEGRTAEEIKLTQGEANPLFQAIRKHGLAREYPLIIATIKVFSEGKVRVTPDKRVVDATGQAVKGYDLSNEVERRVTVS